MEIPSAQCFLARAQRNAGFTKAAPLIRSRLNPPIIAVSEPFDSSVLLTTSPVKSSANALASLQTSPGRRGTVERGEVQMMVALVFVQMRQHCGWSSGNSCQGPCNLQVAIAGWIAVDEMQQSVAVGCL
jgi:hypothetical protein